MTSQGLAYSATRFRHTEMYPIFSETEQNFVPIFIELLSQLILSAKPFLEPVLVSLSPMRTFFQFEPEI